MLNVSIYIVVVNFDIMKKHKLLIIGLLFLILVGMIYLLTLLVSVEKESISEIKRDAVVYGPTNVPTLILTPTIKPKPKKVIKGYGEISEYGNTTKFVMNIPETGGKISGTLTGFCHGTLEDVFDNRTGFIQGTMTGKCLLLNATGRFEGEIDLREKEGSGKYEGKAFVTKKNGNWKLVIKP